MKAEHDREADATYVTLRKGVVVKTIELSDSVMVDVSADGNPLGVEVLGHRSRKRGCMNPVRKVGVFIANALGIVGLLIVAAAETIEDRRKRK